MIYTFRTSKKLNLDLLKSLKLNFSITNNSIYYITTSNKSKLIQLINQSFTNPQTKIKQIISTSHN